MQNSALNWASDHRIHHRYTDTDKDPYNAGKGFFWSHMGWIFYQSRQQKQLTNVGDLMRDRWVRWQHRNGIRWYQWDPTKWLIRGLSFAGMTRKLHRVPPQLILRARMEVEALEAEKHLQAMPQEIGHSLRERVTAAKERFDHALAEWGTTRARYWELKKAAWENSEGAKHWKEKLAAYESRLKEARLQWRTALQGISRGRPPCLPEM